MYYRFWRLAAIMWVLSACHHQTVRGDTRSYPIENREGTLIGTAHITDLGKHGIQLHIKAHNLPPDLHGLHFHDRADCTAPDFTSAGTHINPNAAKHGLKHPEGPDNGDMPNLFVNAKKIASYTYINNRISLVKTDTRPALLDKDGSALVIHANHDDYISQPIGQAGARIACAEIN